MTRSEEHYNKWKDILEGNTNDMLRRLESLDLRESEEYVPTTTSTDGTRQSKCRRSTRVD